jgi:hypothetical protein
MTIRTLAAAALAISLLVPAAFAGNNFGNPNAPAGSEVTNKLADYPVDTVTGGSSEALVVLPSDNGEKQFNTGDYIDETNAERSQRSSR